jgi:hypothetical protein
MGDPGSGRGNRAWASMAVVALVVALGAVGVTLGPDAEPEPRTGHPFYPDLVAIAPDDLYFSTELMADGTQHVLLRFTSSVMNAGEGPLELAGTAKPGNTATVRQVVYDAPEGGEAVERRDLGVDLIYHPAHFHFHMEEFATFALFQIDGEGNEVQTGTGGKQSSCVLDNVADSPDVTVARTYQACELERQGLSVGWRDSYAASLPDQWVDLGDAVLVDGDYVLRYTVDPQRQLAEQGRVSNNVAETRFTVVDGVIVDRPEPPRCAIEGPASGAVGATLTLRCSHFPEGTMVSVFWGEWDPWGRGTAPVTTFAGKGETEVTASVAVPEVEPGSWVVTAMAWDGETRRPVSATVIYEVETGPGASPVASPVSHSRNQPMASRVTSSIVPGSSNRWVAPSTIASS